MDLEEGKGGREEDVHIVKSSIKRCTEKDERVVKTCITFLFYYNTLPTMKGNRPAFPYGRDRNTFSQQISLFRWYLLCIFLVAGLVTHR